MKLLVTEKHHKCIHCLLKVFYTWNSLEFQEDSQPSSETTYVCNMDRDSVFQLWNKLVSLFEITRCVNLFHGYDRTKQRCIRACKLICERHDYLDCLRSWVSNGGSYFVSGGDLVRRVFDKLLICQICCLQLEVIPSSNRGGARGILGKWRTRFYEELIGFSREYIGKRGSVDWIGGVGNHKDAFLPVYANLVAFYALSKCVLKEEPESSGAMLLSEVDAIGEAIKPFLGNPLIYNLYSALVKSHEKCFGRNADNLGGNRRGSDTDWVEFNPYFLLR